MKFVSLLQSQDLYILLLKNPKFLLLILMAFLGSNNAILEKLKEDLHKVLPTPKNKRILVPILRTCILRIISTVKLEILTSPGLLTKQQGSIAFVNKNQYKSFSATPSSLVRIQGNFGRTWMIVSFFKETTIFTKYTSANYRLPLDGKYPWSVVRWRGINQLTLEYSELLSAIV